jgi:hypothetical protein
MEGLLRTATNIPMAFMSQMKFHSHSSMLMARRARFLERVNVKCYHLALCLECQYYIFHT